MTNRSTLHFIFRGLTKILAGIAGIFFIFGGGIISVARNTDRGTGEFFGILIALATGLVALLTHGAAEHFDDGDSDQNQPSPPASA